MVKSTAIFHEYGGAEKPVGGKYENPVRPGFYANVAEIWQYRN